jgi:hypothetical protein
MPSANSASITTTGTGAPLPMRPGHVPWQATSGHWCGRSSPTPEQDVSRSGLRYPAAQGFSANPVGCTNSVARRVRAICTKIE